MAIQKGTTTLTMEVQTDVVPEWNQRRMRRRSSAASLTITEQAPGTFTTTANPPVTQTSVNTPHSKKNPIKRVHLKAGDVYWAQPVEEVEHGPGITFKISGIKAYLPFNYLAEPNEERYRQILKNRTLVNVVVLFAGYKNKAGRKLPRIILAEVGSKILLDKQNLLGELCVGRELDSRVVQVAYSRKDGSVCGVHVEFPEVPGVTALLHLSEIPWEFEHPVENFINCPLPVRIIKSKLIGGYLKVAVQALP